MTIKTVSQLPDYMDPLQIRDNTYFGVSYPISESENKYISQKLRFSRLNQEILNNVSTTYNITPDFKYEVENTLSSMISGVNFKFSGVKIFRDGAKYEKEMQDTAISSALTNKKYVDDHIQYAIANQPSFIKPDSTTNAWLEPLDGNNNKNDVFVTGDGDMYGWYLNNGKCTNEVRMNHSGNLVIYGYVSSPKNVQTSQCWIALEAFIGNKWKMIQMQPWIMGAKASFFQYVGFNAPVAEGLKVRIVTGFQPNLNSTGYGNTGLIYSLNSKNEDIQEMNAFYGYIIH